MSTNVTVIGTGYVGLVTGVCLAHSGHSVTCVDVDKAKIEGLRKGVSPIFEPGIEDLIREGADSGRLTFATPADGWAPLIGDIVFVAVGTPQSDAGAADLSQVRAVVDALCDEADKDFVMVMKSTVPPGTGEALLRRHLSCAQADIAYVSNPEFLREGHAIDDWFAPDRIVLGSADPKALDAVTALYDDIESEVVRTDTASAETIKYASNAFLSTKISFVNEIANVCDCVGADIDQVAHGIGMDKRIGPDFLKAGIGYGGSCFPKDTHALDFISMLHGYEFRLLKSVIEVNSRQRLLPVLRLSRMLGGLEDRVIVILGLTFKPDTDDTREAPALEIVPLFLEEGAKVRMVDPMAPEVLIPGAERVEDVYDALAGADAVVLTTEWPQFTGLDWERVASLMSGSAVVFDGRNALDQKAVRAAGLRYVGVGRDGEHRGTVV